MFFLFERPQQLDFENYQIIWWFVKNIQILTSMIDGGQKWFNFQESIIHIRMWPFTHLPIKRHLALRKIEHNKTSFLYTSMHEKIYMEKESLMPKKRKDLSSIEALSLVKKAKM